MTGYKDCTGEIKMGEIKLSDTYIQKVKQLLPTAVENKRRLIGKILHLFLCSKQKNNWMLKVREKKR